MFVSVEVVKSQESRMSELKQFKWRMICFLALVSPVLLSFTGERWEPYYVAVGFVPFVYWAFNLVLPSRIAVTLAIPVATIWGWSFLEQSINAGTIVLFLSGLVFTVMSAEENYAHEKRKAASFAKLLETL